MTIHDVHGNTIHPGDKFILRLYRDAVNEIDCPDEDQDQSEEERIFGDMVGLDYSSKEVIGSQYQTTDEMQSFTAASKADEETGNLILCVKDKYVQYRRNENLDGEATVSKSIPSQHELVLLLQKKNTKFIKLISGGNELVLDFLRSTLGLLRDARPGEEGSLFELMTKDD